MYITGHRQRNPIDFGECQVNWFFYRNTKKNSYTLRSMESNSLKCSSVETVHSIKPKFDMYIIDCCPTYCVDFGEFRFNSFFLQEYKKGFLYITAHGVKLYEVC